MMKFNSGEKRSLIFPEKSKGINQATNILRTLESELF